MVERDFLEGRKRGRERDRRRVAWVGRETKVREGKQEEGREEVMEREREQGNSRGTGSKMRETGRETSNKSIKRRIE